MLHTKNKPHAYSVVENQRLLLYREYAVKTTSRMRIIEEKNDRKMLAEMYRQYVP